ncbi:hypothetical protein JTB14_034870 [Gonioctena quinquepunctata]|nr:hypothetical protein JTB14_034870 [Gonioctena quinquepunctata]
MTPLKILQTNLERARAAHDLAFTIVEENDTDLILTSEPNKTILSTPDWTSDNRKDCRNETTGIKGFSKLDGAVRIQWKMFDIYFSYVPPNITMDEFKR